MLFRQIPFRFTVANTGKIHNYNKRVTAKSPISFVSTYSNLFNGKNWEISINNQQSIHKRKFCSESFQIKQAIQHSHEPENVVQDIAEFPGARSKFIDTLQFIDPDNFDPIPVYRVMNRNGIVIDDSQDPNLSKETILKMYKGKL